MSTTIPRTQTTKTQVPGLFSRECLLKDTDYYCASYENQSHRGDGPTSVLGKNQYSMTVFTA